MRNFLVPIDPDARRTVVLDAARQVAEMFGGYVEGMALRQDVPEIIAAEFIVAAPTLDPEAQRDLVRRARQAFQGFMEAAGVARHSAPCEGPSWGWAGPQLASDMHVGSHGRLFDLIVLGRPDAAGEARVATVEAALFESGRPVLLVPPAGAKSLAGTVVIAWNGSTETARTVALGMPLLRKAARVIVLTVEGWDVEGPGGESLAQSLRRSGVAAEAASRDARSSPGHAVLEHARGFGADLLVKGAYTQSRLRQMIFGGATRHIISSAQLPVLIAN